MSQAEAQALFDSLVARVRDLPDVRYLAMPSGGRDVYAFITDRDDDLCLTLFERLDALSASETEAHLHIVYLADRDLDDFLRPRPDLVYSRS